MDAASSCLLPISARVRVCRKALEDPNVEGKANDTR